jgi:hypothetical protein
MSDDNVWLEQRRSYDELLERYGYGLAKLRQTSLPETIAVPSPYLHFAPTSAGTSSAARPAAPSGTSSLGPRRRPGRVATAPCLAAFGT